MIKKLFLALMLLMPMSVFAQKFGVIKAQEVMESMPEFTDMKTKIEAASKTYEDEFAKLQAEAQKKAEELQTLDKDTSTPDAIKERRFQELQELGQKIDQFRQTAQQDLQRQQAQLIQPIQEKVMKAIQTVGTEGGYTLIFDSMEPLFTGATVEDVTAKVKTALGIK